MFDVGQLEATLDLDRSPFEAGLQAAQRDALAWAKQKFTATLDLDTRTIPAQIALVKSLLDALDGQVEAGLDPAQAMAAIELIRAEMSSLGDLNLGSDFDTLPAEAKLAALRAQLDAFTQTYTAQADLDIVPAETNAGVLSARLQALSAQRPTITPLINVAPALGQLTMLSDRMRTLSGGGAGGAGGIPALLGAAGEGNRRTDIYYHRDPATTAGEAGESLADMLYGTSTRSFLSRMLSPLTMIQSIFSAEFGSLGSLAGFGSEHLLTTGLGIGGLGVAGGIGALTTMLANLTTTAVGGGSNALVSHEAMSNVEDLIEGYTNMNQLIAKVGPTAAAAEAQTAMAWTAMTSNFDLVSGAAQAMSMKVDQQFIQLATVFTPLIANAAEKNLTIMNSALKPLMSWLEGSQGQGIFTQLENDFAKFLPQSISEATNAIEIFLKAMTYVESLRGPSKLAADLAKLNTTSGMTKLDTFLRKMITDFHTCEQFIEALGRTLVDIFSRDAGTATSVIGLLTKGLQQLDHWITTVGGSDLRNLFTVHKTELLALLQNLGHLLVSFGAVYIKIAPYFVQFITYMLEAANAVFDFTQRIPGLAQLTAVAIALFVMQERAHTLTTAIRLLRDVWNLPSTLVSTISNAASAVAGLAAKLGLVNAAGPAQLMEQMSQIPGQSEAFSYDLRAVATSEGLVGATASASALEVGLLTGAFALVAAGTYLLVEHFGVLRGLMIGAAAGVAVLTGAFIVMDSVPIVAVIAGIGMAIVGLVAACIWLADNWHQVWTDITNWFEDAVTFLRSGWGTLLLVFTPIGQLMLIALHWQAIWDTVKSVAVDVWHYLETAFNDVVGFLRSDFSLIALAIGLMTGPLLLIPVVTALVAANWKTIWDGMKDAVEAVVNWFEGIPAFFENLWDQIVNGAKYEWGVLVSTIEAIPDDILKLFKDAGTWLLDVGKNIILGLIHGLEDGAKDIGHLVTSIGGDIVKGFKDFLGIFSPSTVMQTVGTNTMQGMTNGINAGSKQTVQAALNAAKAITNAFGSLSSTQTASKSMQAVEKLMNSLKTVLTDMSKMSTTQVNFSAIVADFKQLSSIAPELGQLGTAIDKSSASFKKLNDALKPFTQATGSLKSIATDMLDFQKAMAKISLNTDVVYFQQLARALNEMKSGTLTQDASAFKKLESALKPMAQVAGSLNTLTNRLRTFSDTIAKVNVGSLVTQFDQLMTALQKIGTTGTTGVGGVMAESMSGKSFITQLASSFKQLESALKPINDVASALNTLATRLDTLQRSWANVNLPQIVNDFNAFAWMATGSLVPALNGLATALSKMKDSQLESDLHDLDTVLSDMATSVTKLGTVTSTIAGVNIPGDFATLASAALTLRSGLSSVWSGIQSDATSHWDEIADYFHSVESNVLSPLQDLVNQIDTIAGDLRDAWSKMFSDMTSDWGQVLSYESALPSKVESPFQSMESAIPAIVAALWANTNAKYVSGIDTSATDLNKFFAAVSSAGAQVGWSFTATIPMLAAGANLAHIGLGASPMGVYNRATAIVGEGNPRFPEYVLPTDPKYAKSSMALLMGFLADSKLMASGGTLGATNPTWSTLGVSSGMLGVVPATANKLATATSSTLTAKQAAAAAAGASGKLGALPGNIAANLQSFFTAVLQMIGAPVTGNNIANLEAWSQAEGGWFNNTALYNPLNTTMREAGSTVMAGGSSAGVQAYGSLAAGVTATAATLVNGLYPGIMAALMSNAPLSAFEAAVSGSPWGTTDFAQGGKLPINSFDMGGMLPEGLSLAFNGTGSPEPIPGPGGGGAEVTVYAPVQVTAPDSTAEAMAAAAQNAVEKSWQTFAAEYARR